MKILSVLLYLLLTDNVEGQFGSGNDCGGLEIEATTSIQFLRQVANPGADGCQAVISSPEGTEITITVLALNTTFSFFSDILINDHGTIRDLTISCSGLDLPYSYTFGNLIFVYASSFVESFNISYSYEQAEEDDTPNFCDVTELSGRLTPQNVTSENYPGGYFNGLQCNLVIRAPENCNLTLNITYSLETFFDFLTVCPDANVNDVACTRLTSFGFAAFTAVREINLEFKTDFSCSESGIVITYFCESEWGPWEIDGCRYNRSTDSFLTVEKRFRSCPIESCDDSELEETRFFPCGSSCKRCCGAKRPNQYTSNSVGGSSQIAE